LYALNRKTLANSKRVTVLRSAFATRVFSSRNEPPPDRRRAPANGKGHAANQVENKNDQQPLQQALKPFRRNQPRITITASEAGEHVSYLQERLSELGSLPPVWSGGATLEKSNNSVDERETIFREANALLDRIEKSVNTQQLNPSGKHGRELSLLLGQILEVYSKTAVPFGDDTSIFDACCRILTLLEMWNLDVMPFHYSCAVEVAARESRWKEASILFSDQIDPDAFGQAPMEITHHLAVGLYSIARNAQLEGGSTVDHVMDAVLKLAMVCPTDQDEYILSAGIALGHAAEGESFANYLKNSYNSSRLGEPLNAAVMNACVLSGEADRALELFQELVSDPLRGDSEWQYAGEYNSMHPLCRDVAMRAFGDCSSMNLSEVALELYQQVKNDDFQISIEALCGVVKACERDGRWGEAVEIFTEFLDRCRDPGWLVVGNEAPSVVSREQAIANGNMVDFNAVLQQALPQIGNMVASVMRSSNADKKFGMALLCSQLVCNTLMSADPTQDKQSFRKAENPSTLLLSCFQGQEDPIVASIVALSGLNCDLDAFRLYEAAVEEYPLHSWYNARNCCEFVQSNHSAANVVVSSPWQNGQRHMQLLLSACSAIENSNVEMESSQITLLASALSKAMRACTAAGQPETSLWLTKRVYSVLASKDAINSEKTFSLGNAVSSFFGYPDAQPNGYQESKLTHAAAFVSETAVLAESISAYRAMGRPDEGLEILDCIPDSFGNSSSPHRKGPKSDSRWIPVVNQAIFLLADQNRVDDAFALYGATNEETQDHETLIAMATAFEKDEQWKEIIKIYYHALKCGRLSEKLAFLAMKAVVNTSSKEMPKQLRLIAKSACEVAGMNEKEWIESRYWVLDRKLGFTAARLLMWWGDASTAHEMKLRFAIEQVESRRKAGLTPKNVVLRYIVNGIRHYKGPTEILPLSRTQWLNLLRAVIDEAQNSSLWYDASFLESVLMSFLWLDDKKECVAFVRDAVERGVQITQATVDEVTELCRTEGLPMDDLLLMSRSVN
jgi:hypothetical protein